MPLKATLELLAKCADALEYAHKQSVVHRDIKPANLMFDPQTKELKVTDFGIARITDSSKTKTGVVLGTPSYMSPEQLSGKKVTGQSDLFSLGVVLYQLITGTLPFKADSMATLMYKIANEVHVPITSLKPDIPECVSEIVDRALDKDLTQRFQTGGEMALQMRACKQALAS